MVNRVQLGELEWKEERIPSEVRMLHWSHRSRATNRRLEDWVMEKHPDGVVHSAGALQTRGYN